MTFGLYKGHQLYLLHVAKDAYGNVQSPLFAPLRKEATWYPDLLARKTQDGFVSHSLEIYSRDGYDAGKDLINVFNAFKQKVRSK